MAEYQPPRGMKDIVPDEMERRKWIYTNIRNVLDSYGYSEVATTELEMWDTLAAKAGEDNLGEVYDFKDKGDRRLALRFDLTCGIARMVAGMRTPKPIKLYAIGNAWRYDAPQKGRYRCFTQWDVELFGTDSTAADAEIISLSSDILKSLGLDFEVRINNRKLVENIFSYLKIDKKLYSGAMRTVDKIPKLSEYDILEEFKNAGISKSQAISLLEVLGRKGKPKDLILILRKEFKVDKKIQESIDTLENLFANLGKECILDLSIVRGIGYYTGIVFEAFDPKEEKLGSLFAGGRFDGLVGVYGKEDMPAVGVGGGIERLLEVMGQKNAFDNLKRPKSVFIAPINDNVRPYAKNVATSMRKNGFVTELDLTGRNLKKQFDYANKKGFSFVAVIGDKEEEEKCFMLRDMVSGKEKKMTL
ncbi:MAG: histidine--tRNA ligase [DPANN group archaeon]|nr:histidine--tRNA ligase [DPANN group archaeon]